jgi:hypothetical protein
MSRRLRRRPVARLGDAVAFYKIGISHSRAAWLAQERRRGQARVLIQAMTSARPSRAPRA